MKPVTEQQIAELAHHIASGADRYDSSQPSSSTEDEESMSAESLLPPPLSHTDPDNGLCRSHPLSDHSQYKLLHFYRTIL